MLAWLLLHSAGDIAVFTLPAVIVFNNNYHNYATKADNCKDIKSLCKKRVPGARILAHSG